MGTLPAEATMHIGIEISEDLQALLATATDDTVEKVNAGAQLTHALYLFPAEVITGLPEHVLTAVMRAQVAYGVGRCRPDSEEDGPVPVKVVEQSDPIRYIGQPATDEDGGLSHGASG